MTLKELQEKRGKLAAEIKRQADLANAKDFKETPESRQAWDAANADYNAVEGEVKALETRAAYAARAAEVAGHNSPAPAPGRDEKPGRENVRSESRAAAGPTEEQRNEAIVGWMRSQLDERPTARQIAAAEAVGLSLNNRYLDINLPMLPSAEGRANVPAVEIRQEAIRRVREQRAQGVQVGADGGYLTGSTMAAAFELAMLWYGGVASAAETLRTATGEPFHWPGSNDTGNTGAQIGENVTDSEQDASFSQDTWTAYKFTSKIVKIGQELLEDSSYDVVAMIGQMLGERLARIKNTKCTTGSGAGTINGIVTASSLGVTSATATAITADELIDLVYSVDPAYRPAGKFMLNDGIIKYIRKLKDGNGQYLWSTAAGLNGGQAESILGYPVVMNNDMQSSVATGTKTVLFGDLSKYKIREVRGVRFYRLQERYRDADQDGFVALMRFDGNLLNSGGNPVKHLLQA